MLADLDLGAIRRGGGAHFIVASDRVWNQDLFLNLEPRLA